MQDITTYNGQPEVAAAGAVAIARVLAKWGITADKEIAA